MPQTHQEIRLLLHDNFYIVPRKKVNENNRSFTYKHNSYAYQIRDQATSVETRVLDSLKNIYYSFNLQTLNGVVYSNECARPSTAITIASSIQNSIIAIIVCNTSTHNYNFN